MEIDSDFAMAVAKNVRFYSSRIEQLDINVCVGDQSFSCNSFLLCACSEFFQVLMHSKSSKSISEKRDTLVIWGINSDIFGQVLNAIFKGENMISETNVIEMWYAAHHLQINFLLQKCETFIVDHVTVGNYLQFHPHVRRFKSEIVLDKIRKMMKMNFNEFRQTETFLKLSVDDLIAIIKSDQIKSHDCVVESVLHWVEYEVSNCEKSKDEDNREMKLNTVLDDGIIEVLFDDNNLVSETELQAVNRRDCIGQVISSIHMELVSKDSLKTLLDNDLVMDNREARDVVRKAVSSQLELETQVARSCSDTGDTHGVVAMSGILTETDNATNSESLNVDHTQGSIHPLQHMFIFLDVNRKLKSYNILTNQFFLIKYFDIEGYDTSYKKISIINNNILCVLLSSSPDKSGRSVFKYAHLSNSGKVLWQLRLGSFLEKDSPHCIVNGTFIYAFCTSKSTLEIFRTKVKSDNNLPTMTNFGHFNIQGTLKYVANFKHKIISIYNAIQDEKMYVYSFNTETRVLDFVAQMPGNDDRIVTLCYCDRFFILQRNGNLTELVEKNENLIVEILPPLWSLSLTIYGAVIIQETLYIAADLKKTEHLPSSCQFGSMEFINILQNSSCQYATLDQNFLGEEI